MAKSDDAAEKPDEKKPSSAGPGLFAFTMDASTGQFTKLEKVEDTGTPLQLSELDKVSLQSRESWHTLEAIVEQAFEAGIGCVLGNGDEKDAAQESEDEADVRRTLLQPLIERSASQALEAEGGSAQQKSAAAAPHPPSSTGPAQH